MALGLGAVSASSGNISHSYHASNAIPDGSIVSLDPDRSDYVVFTNVLNGDRMLGVTVASNNSLLAVDPANNKVQVATSGTVDTLVSDLNGDISVGDQIAASPINGVGMKAENGSHVIGLAQTSLKSTSDGAITQTITDKQGHPKQILVGLVRLSISVGTDTVVANGVQLNSLQRLGKSLTGRVLPTWRILLSMCVAFVALVALITLIYASIYGSIISVGRNPLAKYAIFRTLSTVLGMAAFMSILAFGTIFLLLH